MKSRIIEALSAYYQIEIYVPSAVLGFIAGILFAVTALIVGPIMLWRVIGR